MTKQSSGKYKLAALLFIFVLFVFLVVSDLLLVSRLRSQLFNEEYKHALDEIKMVGIFVREPILKQYYDEVEQFLTQWAEESNDILSIEAVMPNGFVLVQVGNSEGGTNKYTLEKQINFFDKELITLKVVKNFKHAALMKKLQRQLIAGSIFLTVFFGFILWLTIKKFALVPLEQAKGNLETIVHERTKTWEEANKNLLFEIDKRKKAQQQLQIKINELEEFYGMAVGREVKMKKLKEEIVQLRSRLENIETKI